MSDIEKLKQMDIEEVRKKTYIAPKMLQALIEEDFKTLGNKSKALGFVKIIERELGLDLGELRQKIEEYYENVVETSQNIQNNGVEKTPKEKNFLYYSLGVVVLLVIAGTIAGYRYFTSSQSLKSESNFLASYSSSSLDLSTSSSSSVALSSQSFSSEENDTLAVSSESNQSEEKSENLKEPPSLAPPSITLIPRKKVWVGVVYLDNHKRKVYVTASPIELNTSRDQLIVTGHGVLDIDIDGNITKYNSRHKLRFLYRARELEPIDTATFKLYNRGRDW